jgi:hypothetical protein
MPAPPVATVCKLRAEAMKQAGRVNPPDSILYFKRFLSTTRTQTRHTFCCGLELQKRTTLNLPGLHDLHAFGTYHAGNGLAKGDIMNLKSVIAMTAAAAGLFLAAPGEAQAQYYGHEYNYSTSRSYYPSTHYRSDHSRYSSQRYNSHPGRGHAYGKYKNKSKHRYDKYDKHRRHNISIGPRWDPRHGWIYY